MSTPRPVDLSVLFPKGSPAFLKLNASIARGPVSLPLGATRKPAENRLRQSANHGLNKLETDAWQHLKSTLPNSRVVPHGIRLALGNGVTYLPDFAAFDLNHPRDLQCFEVKGPFMREDASVKLKTAAAIWPGIKFTLIWREGRNAPWSSQEILP
jgi:hypothetical protein